jgi:uncharacterized protein (DUF1330 family)
MALTLCVLLHAVPGNERRLVEYEDEVLALIPDHGGLVVSRVRALEPGDGPYEVHVIEFPSEAALDAYMADPQRTALAGRRDQAIARTTVFPVTQL